MKLFVLRYGEIKEFDTDDMAYAEVKSDGCPNESFSGRFFTSMADALAADVEACQAEEAERKAYHMKAAERLAVRKLRLAAELDKQAK